MAGRRPVLLALCIAAAGLWLLSSVAAPQGFAAPSPSLRARGGAFANAEVEKALDLRRRGAEDFGALSAVGPRAAPSSPWLDPPPDSRRGPGADFEARVAVCRNALGLKRPSTWGDGVGSPAGRRRSGLEKAAPAVVLRALPEPKPNEEMLPVDLNRTSLYWGLLTICILSVLFSSYLFN
ncbi:unnamed protein product [Prorocentrum cordatum]|uniref:Photosystem II reaction center protein L n=1 Tax=Prorocentrum cordatum TaxID=2364126 RepID=A0ABN9S5Z3_9DINO|nr:unnamed protein product [Polarella glacialis]